MNITFCRGCYKPKIEDFFVKRLSHEEVKKTFCFCEGKKEFKLTSKHALALGFL